MNMIRKMLGKLSDIGAMVTACATGFVCGMVAVHTVDMALYTVITVLGLQPLTGIAGTIVGLVLGLCYALIYLIVAFKVCDRVEDYINECRASYKYSRVYVVA